MDCGYNRLEEIGSGTYGKAYKIERDNVFEVIKFYMSVLNNKNILKGSIGESISEIDVMFNVRHPNLVRGIGLKLAKQCPELFNGIKSHAGIIMPWFNGGDMAHITDVYNLPYAEGVDILDLGSLISIKCLRQLCSAIVCLGDAGYYNFDIKPQNVLYNITSDDGFIYSEDDIDFYLADYGLCMPTREYGQILTPGGYLSTPFTTAPESMNKYNIVYLPRSMSWSLSLTVLTIFLGEKLEVMFKKTSHMKDPEFFSYMHKNIDSIVDSIYKKIELKYKTIEPFLSRKLKTKFMDFIEILMGMLIVNIEDPDLPMRLDPREVSELLKDKNNECIYHTDMNISMDNIPDADVREIITSAMEQGDLTYPTLCLGITLAFRYILINPENYDTSTIVKYCILIARYFYSDNAPGMTVENQDIIVNMLITFNGIIYINPLFTKSFRKEQINDIILLGLRDTPAFKRFLNDKCPYEELDLEISQYILFPTTYIKELNLMASPSRPESLPVYNTLI